MTPTTLAHLRALVAGFRGRFFFDAERGDLAYLAKECEAQQCECERKTNSDGDQDCSLSLGVLDGIDDAMEPIAEMLNAVPALVDRVEALERECENVGKGQDRAERNERELHADNIKLRALLREACNAADENNNRVGDGAIGAHGKRRERIAEIRREGGIEP